MAELALEDVERDPLTGELDRMRVAQLVLRKAALTPARAASRRNSARTAAPDHGSPGRALDDAEQRPDRQLWPCVQPRAQLLPAPLVHADSAPAASLALADQQRSAPLVEIVLGERERFLDTQPGAHKTAIIARTRQP